MERRHFLQCTGALSLSALATACQNDKTGKVLAAIVRDVAVPDSAAAVAASRQLRVAIAKLVGTPTPPALASARDEWKKALLTWTRVRCFPGPESTVNRVLSWPARPAAVDVVLKDSKPMSGNFLEAVGVDAKGLFALEYLFFPPGAQQDDAVVAQFAGREGGRRRRMIAEISKDAVSSAEALSKALVDGAGYGETFAKAGQESVNRLVGQMVATAEGVSVGRIGAILALDRERLAQPVDVEGGLSGLSRDIVLAELEATERLYRGGLRQLIPSDSAAVDEHVLAAFSATITVLRKLAGPLEQVARDDRASLQAAGATTKALALALAAELTPALGVKLPARTARYSIGERPALALVARVH